MSSPPIETLRLRLSFDDLVDLAGDDGDERPPEDDEPDQSHSISVVRLGTSRFRLAEPVSLSPFGCRGPMLNLGDVIEATPIAGAGHRYVRIVERARIAGVRIHAVARTVLERMLSEEAPRQLLAELIDAGAHWEWAASNLVLQVPLPEGETEMPAPVRERVERLGRWIGEAREAHAGEQDRGGRE